MNIHEYQAKSLLREYGVKTLKGYCVKREDEIEKALAELGLPVVGKVQVHAGGRGKSGGIKILKTVEEVKEFVLQFLNKPFKTYQLGSRSLPVSAILFEKPANIKKEMYFAITYDKKSGNLVILVSPFGGVEIEEISKEKPESILKVQLFEDKVSKYQIRDMMKKLQLDATLYEKELSDFINNCLRLYLESDATLLEINPLIETWDNQLVALDAKINFDYRAVENHPHIKELFDPTQENPNELRANEIGINYIELEGDIGCLVNGAGLAMATMDIIKFYGGKPANFLDVGGGATKEQLMDAFKILLLNKEIKAILVNIFGGILRTDLLAESLVAAVKQIQPKVPIVIRLEGTNVEAAMKILENSDVKLFYTTSLSEAAKKVIELAKSKNYSLT